MRLEIQLDEETVALIDSLRGPVPRATWVRLAVAEKLEGHDLVALPTMDAEPERPTFLIPTPQPGSPPKRLNPTERLAWTCEQGGHEMNHRDNVSGDKVCMCGAKREESWDA